MDGVKKSLAGGRVTVIHAVRRVRPGGPSVPSGRAQAVGPVGPVKLGLDPLTTAVLSHL